MTVRRRFFPVAPVQQVPGQRVELEVQLRPQGVAPPAAAAPPAAIVTWMARGSDMVFYSEVVETSPGVWVGRDGEGDFGTGDYGEFRGRPGFLTWMGEGEPPGAVVAMAVPSFACTTMRVERYRHQGGIHGAALGAGDVTWSLAWDRPFVDLAALDAFGFTPAADPRDPRFDVSRYGDIAWADGAVVAVLPSNQYNWTDEHATLVTLTATASSGGAVVGVLRLDLRPSPGF